MLFEIHITDNDLTTGSIPITWCLDKEMLDKIKAKPGARVVVSVIPFKDDAALTSKENRYVFTLKHMMGYISFRRPGKNKIYAYLETESDNPLDKWHGDYTSNVVNSNGDYSKHILGYSSATSEGDPVEVPGKYHSIPLEVDVPEEAFGKQPSGWEKNWVLWLIKDKGTDQCAFRRRRLFAYTLQPFILLLKLFAMTVVTLIAFLLGMRGFTLKYLFQPIVYTLPVACDLMYGEGTFFWRPEPKKWENKTPNTFGETVSYVLTRGWSLPFMPLVLGLVTLVTLTHAWKGVFFVVTFIVLLILLIATCVNIGAIFGWLGEKMDYIGGDNSYEDLVCDGNPIRKPKNRSIKLRYLAIKSKVCKPFAG